MTVSKPNRDLMKQKLKEHKKILKVLKKRKLPICLRKKIISLSRTHTPCTCVRCKGQTYIRPTHKCPSCKEFRCKGGFHAEDIPEGEQEVCRFGCCEDEGWEQDCFPVLKKESKKSAYICLNSDNCHEDLWMGTDLGNGYIENFECPECGENECIGGHQSSLKPNYGDGKCSECSPNCWFCNATPEEAAESYGLPIKHWDFVTNFQYKTCHHCAQLLSEGN